MSKDGNEIRKWYNNVYQWDVTEASLKINPWLKNYGRDRFTYSPELTYTTANKAW